MGKIGNIFKEGELDKDTSVEIFDRSENKASRPPMYYEKRHYELYGVIKAKSNNGLFDT